MVQVIDNGKAHVVRVLDQRTVATIRDRRVPVHVSSPGVQGPAGAPGASGAGYTHQQPTPALRWTINHNLGYRPAVELYDAGSQEVSADVAHLNDNTVIVDFAIAIAGFARLN